MAQTYEVTLTQKVKTSVEADSPAQAIERAATEVSKKQFEPTSWSVKDKTE